VLVREQVAATVSNLLDENAEYVAVLWVNGAMNSSETLALGPKESSNVSFEISPEEGSYEVRIDRLSGILSVSSQEGASFVWWLTIGIPLFAVLNASFFFVWRRRKRRRELGVAFD